MGVKKSNLIMSDGRWPKNVKVFGLHEERLLGKGTKIRISGWVTVFII